MQAHCRDLYDRKRSVVIDVVLSILSAGLITRQPHGKLQKLRAQPDRASQQ